MIVILTAFTVSNQHLTADLMAPQAGFEPAYDTLTECFIASYDTGE